MPEHPRAIILLCAGRGTRMQPLTKHVPKCLLSIDGRPILDYLIDAVLARSEGEVVAVTGFAADRLRQHLAHRYGTRVAPAHNARFEEDINILSVETGVAALHNPERGYLVVETDLLLEDFAWDQVFAANAGSESFWVCKDYYSDTLTGGIVHADAQGWIDAVEYRPNYDARYQGWPKMVGLLSVAPDQVLADRRYRQIAITKTVCQYYLMPWRQHLSDLPCKVLQIDNCFAQSFNTVEDFTRAANRYIEILATKNLSQRT